jgi:CBS domain-containing protein
MRAHQIMTKNVITVTPQTALLDAANIMLRSHASGLPVVDANGALQGVISESDFLRRGEIGTQRKRSRWLEFFMSPSSLASDYVHEVEDVMSRDPVTVTEEASLDELVHLMEKHHIKRLPVMRGKAVVGVVTRSNLLQAVAALSREIPDPTADDDHIRDRVLREINAKDWRPIGLQVTCKNGIVHLHGIIVNDHSRQASIVAAENTTGVKDVHDHLCLVDTYSGFYIESPEDIKAAS